MILKCSQKNIFSNYPLHRQQMSSFSPTKHPLSPISLNKLSSPIKKSPPQCSVVFREECGPKKRLFDDSKEQEIVPKAVKQSGAVANRNGALFELKTWEKVKRMLLIAQFEENVCGFFCKKTAEHKLIYFPKNTFYKYIKDTYNIMCFKIPDEALLKIGNCGEISLHIIEKKSHTSTGSADEKLLLGKQIIEMYRIMLADINIQNISISYVINNFLHSKLNDVSDRRFATYKTIIDNDGIKFYNGDDDYPSSLFKDLELF